MSSRGVVAAAAAVLGARHASPAWLTLLSAAFVATASGCDGNGQRDYPFALTPMLEAVVKPGPTQTVVARNTGGEFEVLPSRAVLLHLRAPWPASLQVSLDGQTIEQVRADDIARKQQLDAEEKGYYELDVTDPDPRDAHWTIAVSPPPSKRQSGSLSLELRSISHDPDATGTDKESAPLTVRIIAAGASGSVEASDVFFSGENSKPPASIVARNVVLAGWIADGMPLENCDPGVPWCEDWHYDIYLDPDFIERYYGGSTPRAPLAGAILPGNPVGKPVPLADRAPDGTVRGITVGSFLLPAGIVGHDFRNFTVELNGWHPSARGPAPTAWKNDPSHADTFWSYDPRDPDGKGEALETGDYVIMSGTLWEDGGHVAGFFCEKLGGFFCGNTPGQPFKGERRLLGKDDRTFGLARDPPRRLDRPRSRAEEPAAEKRRSARDLRTARIVRHVKDRQCPSQARPRTAAESQRAAEVRRADRWTLHGHEER
jgi:hypothetical protein